MKKFTTLAVAASVAVALSGAAFAGGYSRAEAAAMPHHCGVTGLGVSLHQFFGAYDALHYEGLNGSSAGTAQNPADTGLASFFGSGVAVGVDYVVQQWEMGVNVGGDHFERVGTANAVSAINWGAYLGYRWAFAHCLFGSVGLNGGVQSGTTAAAERTPYSIGGYLGLAYDPSEHFELFARVNAVQFNRAKEAAANTAMNGDFWNFFQNGEVGMAYYFGDVV